VSRASVTALDADSAMRRGFLFMAEHSYGKPTVHVYAGDQRCVRVGRFCSLASGVEFFVGGMHRADWISTYPFRVRFDLPGALTDGQPHSRGDIEIGNDVWIAAGATILSGVTIGDGAVVGAGAVVSRDVRPYSVVAGNPAREVRRRFDDEAVDQLLKLAWWDWPLERILENVDALSSPDIAQFISRFSSRSDPASAPAHEDDAEPNLIARSAGASLAG
jgi:acetyltransferase-like isoleucine patch superfamily enzyme